EVGYVGRDEVYAGQLFRREDYARIDDYYIFAVLNGRHILADFAHAAEEDYFYLLFLPAARGARALFFLFVLFGGLVAPLFFGRGFFSLFWLFNLFALLLFGLCLYGLFARLIRGGSLCSPLFCGFFRFCFGRGGKVFFRKALDGLYIAR